MDGLLLEEFRPIRRTCRHGVSPRCDHAVFGGIRRDTQGKAFLQFL